jgi:hypothetical protein
MMMRFLKILMNFRLKQYLEINLITNKMIFKSKIRKRAERIRNDLIRELERMKTEPELNGIKLGRKQHHIRMKINLINELINEK